MPNDFYNNTFDVLPGNRVGSQRIEDEWLAVKQGFDKLPGKAAQWGGGANFAEDTGVADAYLASIAPTYVTSYVNGMTVFVRALNSNLTSTPTINLNSLGVRTIVRPDGTALQASDIISGQVIGLTYNATTNKFQMLAAYGGPAGPTGSLTGNATGGVNWFKGPDIASAASPNIWPATQGNVMTVTGTVATTSFPAAPQAGAQRTLIAAAAWPLTHGANLILPGSVNYTCAAGDRIEVTAITTTQFRINIFKADGSPAVQPAHTFISAQTATAAASLDFTSVISGTVYDEYLFEFENLIPGTNNSSLYVRTSVDNATFDAGATDYSFAGGSITASTGAAGAIASGGAAQMQISALASNAAADGGISGSFRIVNPLGTASNKQCRWQTTAGLTAGDMTALHGGGQRRTTAACNAVRFLMSAGTFSGYIKLIGIRRA